MRTECNNVKELLSCLLDGEVSEKEREELLSHIADCEDCRREFEELTELKEHLSELCQAPDGALADSVMKKINAESPVKKKSFLLRYMGTAAAIIVVVALFAYVRLEQPRLESEGALKQESIPTESVRDETEDLAADGSSSEETESFLESAEPEPEHTKDSSVAESEPEYPMEAPVAESKVEHSAESVKGSETAKPSQLITASPTFTEAESFRLSNALPSSTALIFVDGNVETIAALIGEVSYTAENYINTNTSYNEVIDILVSNSITVNRTDIPENATDTTVVTE